MCAAAPARTTASLGRLVKGDAVKDIDTKGDWTEIEPPTGAYAYVAAQYLKQGVPTSVELTSSTPTPTNVVPEAPSIAANPTEPGAVGASTNVNPETSATGAPAASEPPPKRIIQHEGVVRGTVSIQAPTPFALVNPDTGVLVDYLYTTSPNLDLRRYKGIRIVATGEEAVEERWPSTPVLTDTEDRGSG